jgi:methylmalonyl-CoA epimerase
MEKAEVKSVHEVVLAVKDAEKAVSLYEELFGLKFTLSWELPWEKMKVRAAMIGETQFHIVESTSPDGVIAKFIEKKGEGIHHICFKVKGLKEMIERSKEKGIRLVPENPISVGNVSYIFLHPSSTYGVLIELIEEG